MAMDDDFFQQRLSNLRQAREVLERKRRFAEQQKCDAMAAFGRLWWQLREEQENVKAIKAMSSSLLGRIADGMSLFKRSISQAEQLCQPAAPPVLSTASKCLSVNSQHQQAPSRPIGRSFFIREIGKPNGAKVLEVAEMPLPPAEKNQSEMPPPPMDRNDIADSVSSAVQHQDRVTSANTFPASCDEMRGPQGCDDTIENDPTLETSDTTSSEALNALITEELLKEGSSQDREDKTERVDRQQEAKNESDQPEPPHEKVHLSPMEKLSLLCTLMNNMHFWEDKLNVDDVKAVSPALVHLAIVAARESQKSLLKLLESTRTSKPALCCAAICELVKTYPPEKLLPGDFVRNLFSDEAEVKSLSTYQDAEAASFWGMFIAFALSLLDEHRNTVEQVSSILQQALHSCAQAHCGNSEEARDVLHLFLTSYLYSQMKCNDEAAAPAAASAITWCNSAASEAAASSNSPLHGPGTSGEAVLKLQTPTKLNRRMSRRPDKGLWNLVGGFMSKSFRKQMTR